VAFCAPHKTPEAKSLARLVPSTFSGESSPRFFVTALFGNFNFRARFRQKRQFQSRKTKIARLGGLQPDRHNQQ
jgi:hypothetical protein